MIRPTGVCTLVALHLRQRLLEVLALDNSFHRRSCDRRAFETGFRRTRFDRSGNDARGFTPRFTAQAQLQLILLPHGSREIAALLPSSTVRAYGGAPPPTMPSADFCATIRSPCDDLSPEGLRFANPSPPSGWIEDFHLQAVVQYSAHQKSPRRVAPAGGRQLNSSREHQGTMSRWTRMRRP
jgi:hypothetical protein